MTQPSLDDVLASAARLQRLVPDAVLVGGTAAAWYAGHRESHDHDHVLADLQDRFDTVLEAIERSEGWVTSRVVPGQIILGSLGSIETGIRQMIRTRPLEIVEVSLPSGEAIRIPTLDEILRIKAFLVVRRNQTRDFLDAAALAHRMGIDHAATVLADIDAYYRDQVDSADGVASQVARQLADPRPADARTTRELKRYKRLDAHWHDWSAVVSVCTAVAQNMLDTAEENP